MEIYKGIFITVRPPGVLTHSHPLSPYFGRGSKESLSATPSHKTSPLPPTPARNPPLSNVKKFPEWRDRNHFFHWTRMYVDENGWMDATDIDE